MNVLNNHIKDKMLVMIILAASVLIDISEGGEVVSIFRREGKVFEEACKSLIEELGNDFVIRQHIICKESSEDEFIKLIDSDNPKLVILMDNVAINLFKKYQSNTKSHRIPSLSIMGVMIKQSIAGMKNCCGISYEIPIVTSVVSLRSILGRSTKKVGVIHRNFMNESIEMDKIYCKKEGIEILNISLPDKADSYEKSIMESLKRLILQGIDVLWVPNDNLLLQTEIIKRVWNNFVPQYKIPVIVGIEVLVSPRLNFGTFAVVPDHISLGSQAAAMVYDIRNNNWICEEKRVDPPISVNKTINYHQAKKIFNISEEKLKSIDKILK